MAWICERRKVAVVWSCGEVAGEVRFAVSISTGARARSASVGDELLGVEEADGAPQREVSRRCCTMRLVQLPMPILTVRGSAEEATTSSST